MTIQGGGALAMELVGQLEGVTGAAHVGGTATGNHGIVPAAIAGTSAGAIIATLFWAGYTPRQICEIAHGIFSKGNVDDFFSSKSGGGKLKFKSFKRFSDSVKSISSKEKGRWYSFPVTLMRRWARYMSCGLWLVRHGKGIWARRGIFEAENFVAEIDRRLRESPLLEPVLKDVPLQRRVTFRDVRTAVRLPLFLIAADVSAGAIVLANSVDDDSLDLAIADAVRASASFPGFFQPWRVSSRHACCIDGGTISNFPAWVFTDGFRNRLLQSRDPFFTELAYTPWVHIGLQLAEDSEEGMLEQPARFVRALFQLLTGRGRSRLESLLSRRANRRIDVRQTPLSDGARPSGVLDFDALKDRENIQAAFERGRTDARRQIRPACFAWPPAAKVEPLLSQLAAQVQVCLDGYLVAGSGVRANVFLPVVHKDGDACLKLVYAANMDGDVDERIEFKLHQGVCGLCYKTRQPVLSNLADGAVSLSSPGAEHDTFLRRGERYAPLLIREDRNWVMSVPVFDVTEARRHLTDNRHAEIVVEGPVLGVLNIDAAMNYDIPNGVDREPANQLEDPRVRLVYDSVLNAADKCGLALASHWAEELENG